MGFFFLDFLPASPFSVVPFWYKFGFVCFDSGRNKNSSNRLIDVNASALEKKKNVGEFNGKCED